jgi:hypothetical protein
MTRIREDLMLTYSASRLLTGATIHQGRALIAAYQNAIETASDRRCKGLNKETARCHVIQCESALRSFAGGRA